MITFHASETGSGDYLDLHTTDDLRFYLSRGEARRLAADILRSAADDVECTECHRLNGVHMVDCPTWNTPETA